MTTPQHRRGPDHPSCHRLPRRMQFSAQVSRRNPDPDQEPTTRARFRPETQQRVCTTRRSIGLLHVRLPS